MSSAAKTHYRKAFNSPYLSSADIVEDISLTIDRVVLEPDKTKKTKESFNTAYFKEKEIRPGEPLKPMILNVHNSEVVRDMCGSKFIEDWHGTITVYVDSNVRFGRETVEGLRLRAGSIWVSQGEAEALKALVKEVGADQDGLFKWANCVSFERFPVAKLAQAKKMLEAKRS